MPSLTAQRLSTLLADHPAPCVSIYLPMARTYPDTQQSEILYKDLVGRAEQALREKYPDAQHLVGKCRGVGVDPSLWERRPGGLAVFASADLFEVLDLPQTVPALAAVGASFQVKPLLRLAQSSERFHVLCLTRDHARLLEGDRDGLHELELEGVPHDMEETLAVSQRRDDSAGMSGAATGPESMAVEAGPFPEEGAGRPGGHPAKGKDAKLDAERFFHAVDRALWGRYSRPSGLPLILVALPVNQALFRRVSHNGQLLPEGVEGNPDAFPLPRLHQAVWQIFEGHQQARLRKLSEDYAVARSRGMGSDDLGEVARAAQGGRVGTLLLDAARRLPGSIEPSDGSPRPAARENGDGEDMLDDLAEMVLRHKGNVLVVPADLLPSPTGLAAIYRY